MNFKFRLPPHPLSFSALSFHTLNCCWFSPGWFLSPSLLADLFIRAISSITFLTFELNESWRRSTESAEILCVKDIAFINSTIVCSLMHLYMTETDLDSVVTEINILNKIQKWSDSATSSITMNELLRSLLMSKSRVCPRLSVGPCTCWLWSKVFKTLILSFVVLIYALSMWILKSPAIAKQSNSEEIIDAISVNSSKKAGEYFEVL